jgi:nucleotidyltransferase substrate binding protein (TIGR01987 family)
MESLNLLYQALLKAYSRLNYMANKFIKACDKFDNEPFVSSEEEDELIGYRDALIKRFEFSYDLTWKFIKRYLKEKYSIELVSPRKIFQELLTQNLATPAEVTKLLQMVEARNYTSHTYDESIAQEISFKIIDYAQLMSEIIHKLDLESLDVKPLNNIPKP